MIIRSIIYGSINITMTRIVAESEDPESVQSDLKIAASTGVSGLSIISSSITTSTTTSSDNTNSNNVYIGVFVGIGLLIVGNSPSIQPLSSSLSSAYTEGRRSRTRMKFSRLRRTTWLSNPKIPLKIYSWRVLSSKNSNLPK